MTQPLKIFLATWTMENLPGPTLSMPEQLARISAAGFRGVTAMHTSIAHADQLAQWRREHGLQLESQVQPQRIEDLEPALELALRHDCHHVTAQVDMRPYTLAEAMKIIEAWQPLLEQTNVPVLFETHRQRLTNDLPLTVQLLHEFPDLKLLADLSHYVVSREMPAQPDATDQAAIHQILEHSHGFHGRFASAEQVQIPLGYPQFEGWYALMRQWWLQGFQSWQRRQAGDPALQRRDLSFTCELGPYPYAMTDRHGREYTDRWAESLLLKAEAEALWQQSLALHATEPLAVMG